MSHSVDLRGYTPTIGIEVHAQLNTRTKMFSRSKNDPEETRPNVNVSPVDLGHPGTLPVVNKAAVKHVLTVGVAVGGTLAEYTEFDRKNYFYPDIPKGYQISQYKYPLVSGGNLGGVALTRIHLEEDTGRSSHDKGDYSLVDYNRAGVPLMELVTEPVLHSAEEAGRFARELRLLLRTLGASNANLEKGEMRVEVNVSVSKTKTLGTKVEVKNINSFKAVERAVMFEIERHINLLEEGGTIVQETRGWDEVKQVTFSQRKKESSHDYRYFPDPDIPKLSLGEIKEFNQEVLKSELPELPWERRERYTEDLGLKSDDAEMYIEVPVLAGLIDNLTTLLPEKADILLASNYITSDLMGIYGESGLPESLSFTPKQFAEIIIMAKQGEISSRGVKDILAAMVASGSDPRSIAKERGLFQRSSQDELLPVVKEILKNNEKVVVDYKGGKESALTFLIGQAMKATKGSANPEVLKSLFLSELSR